jgi:hypothetical protein
MVNPAAPSEGEQSADEKSDQPSSLDIHVVGHGRPCAVPTAGLVATICGAVGFVRVRHGDGPRTEVLEGLVIGSGVLILTGTVGFWLWAASRSNWQF